MFCFSNKSRLVSGIFACSMAVFGAEKAAAATSDILFIVDGSGSMWGQIDGVAKIQTAKETMTGLLDKVPSESRIGLMTYGTKDKSSCDDVTLVNKFSTDRGAVKTALAALKPLGKTPISLSLSKGIDNFKQNSSDVPQSIVLVSDGIETCNADPCDTITKAKAAGVNVKVHVVGFDVDDAARKQLKCIADAGGGQYFNASNTDGFKKAMGEVVKVAQAAPVKEEPKEPTITEFFRDDFDGEELGEIWEVSNPNPDNFIVEDGILTVLSTSPGGFSKAKAENTFTYTGELPKGDWDAVLTFTGDYAAAADRVSLGLRKNEKSFLTGSYSALYLGAAQCHSTWASVIRNSKGKLEEIKSSYRSTRNTHCRAAQKQFDKSWDVIRSAHQEQPVKLTFSKRGRAYTTTVEMEGFNNKDSKPIVVTTDKFTSLRSPGKLTFNVERLDRYGVQGEVLMSIDSLVINKVEKQ